MANLVVNGTIYINGDPVGLNKNEAGFVNSKTETLYSSSSVSTGNKTLQNSKRFSDYKNLAFGEYSTATEGYSWYFMPRVIFTNLGLFYVQQNIATQDRRFKIKYVSDTQFNIDYVDGANGIKILGFK